MMEGVVVKRNGTPVKYICILLKEEAKIREQVAILQEQSKENFNEETVG